MGYHFLDLFGPMLQLSDSQFSMFKHENYSILITACMNVFPSSPRDPPFPCLDVENTCLHINIHTQSSLACNQTTKQATCTIGFINKRAWPPFVIFINCVWLPMFSSKHITFDSSNLFWRANFMIEMVYTVGLFIIMIIIKELSQ